MRERVVSRVLGALRFVDATTGARIAMPLVVRADGATFLRNRTGAYVITSAPGMAEYVAADGDPPAVPPLSLRVSVQDASGRYLPRSTRVALPRNPDPAAAAAEASLFRAISVVLYPASTAALAPGWAVIRVSVRDQAGAGLRGAYLRIRRASQPTAANPPLARGMSDDRGEALLPVSGVPVTNWDAADDGPVLSTTIDAVVEAYYEHSPDSFPDPDQIDARRLGIPPDGPPLPSVTTNVQLTSGKETALSLVIPT